MSDFQVKSFGPYADLICTLVAKQFPRPKTLASSNIIDLLEAEFLGTKQNRYGPKPNPESIVNIREVMRAFVANHQPIPIVVPWGSEKPDGTSVDVAEMIALSQLTDLADRMRAHYTPGVHINIRVEDVSAPHLFHWRADQARKEAYQYTADMKDMVSLLELPLHIKAEGDQVSESEFNAKADERLQDFTTAVREVWFYANHADQRMLAKWGWKPFSTELISHYMESYVKLYPTWTIDQHLNLLGRYFAGASARYALKLRGDEREWGGNFLEVAMTPPIPTTEKTFGRRVHYRTFPLEYTSRHIAPWRAKGYLEINNDNVVTPKLASFNDIPQGLEKNTLEIIGSGKVTVQADYVLV